MDEYRHMTVERMGELRHTATNASLSSNPERRELGRVLGEALDEIDALSADLAEVRAESAYWEIKAGERQHG